MFTMHWIHDYQLFLFDFDGILVNSEKLHYLAYKKMCRDRGCELLWDMPTYVGYAMYSSEGLQQGICATFPQLATVPWAQLYAEKKAAYAELLEQDPVELMPGVEALLQALDEAGIKRCVVTHSTLAQVSQIRKNQPILDSIPVWLTREDYEKPKPSPECYQKAIDQLAHPDDRIVGFEDSPRGLQALLGTRAEGVFVTQMFSDEEVNRLRKTLQRDFPHRHSILP